MIDVTFFYVQGQLTSGLTVLQFLLPSFAYVNRIGLVEGVKSLRNGWFQLQLMTQLSLLLIARDPTLSWLDELLFLARNMNPQIAKV